MAFFVIIALYVCVGLMAAVGSITIAQRLFSPRAEQIFFGLFLVPIAGFYLAFTAYFGDTEAWRIEAVAAVSFAVLGIAGCRVPMVLTGGYVLHGLWDLLHEVQVHAGVTLGIGVLTQIPLAYGAFCATYDWAVAAYFYTRRRDWSAAWGRGT